MINPDIFAYSGTAMNICMLFPQVFQTWKTKKTNDLSLITLILFLTSCALWTMYGIAKAAPPIILANTTMGFLNLILLSLKIKYPEKKLKKK